MTTVVSNVTVDVENVHFFIDYNRMRRP